MPERAPAAHWRGAAGSSAVGSMNIYDVQAAGARLYTGAGGTTALLRRSAGPSVL